MNRFRTKHWLAVCLCVCLLPASGCSMIGGKPAMPTMAPKPAASAQAANTQAPTQTPVPTQTAAVPAATQSPTQAPVTPAPTVVAVVTQAPLVTSAPQWPAGEDIEDPSFVEMTEYLAQNEYICGAAMIGHASGPKWEGSYFGLYGDLGHLVEYPFIGKIPDERFLENEGEELYCIVPAKPGTAVTVCQWIVPDGSGQQGVTGQVLYESDSGAPILLRGNVDPSASNLQVTVTDPDGRSITFFPMTNPMDGTLLLAELSSDVWDFTLCYGPLYGGPIDTENVISLADLRGEWTVWGLVDSDGTPVSCQLCFWADWETGLKVELMVRDDEDNLRRCYEGTYYAPEEAGASPLRIRLEMMLTVGEGAADIPPPMLAGEFNLLPTGEPDAIVIAHLLGDPLLPGMENSWIGFYKTFEP